MQGGKAQDKMLDSVFLEENFKHSFFKQINIKVAVTQKCKELLSVAHVGAKRVVTSEIGGYTLMKAE